VIRGKFAVLNLHERVTMQEQALEHQRIVPEPKTLLHQKQQRYSTGNAAEVNWKAEQRTSALKSVMVEAMVQTKAGEAASDTLRSSQIFT
jgi:hypothetical protein